MPTSEQTLDEYVIQFNAATTAIGTRIQDLINQIGENDLTSQEIIDKLTPIATALNELGNPVP